MVKLLGPAMSLDALGTLANTLVFSECKGRRYVRKHVKPKKTQTPAQIANRAMFKFLQQQWSAISPADQATWSAAAAAAAIAPNNAYCSTGLARWKSFHAPGQIFPVAENGDLPIASLPHVAGEVGQACLFIDVFNARDGWGFMVFRSATADFDTARTNCVAVAPLTDIHAGQWIDAPVAAGEWTWNIRFFTTTGKLGPEEDEHTATVT